MSEEKRMSKHVGYADGAKAIDKAALEGAIRRLLADVEHHEEKRPDGSTLVHHRHETDPPADFVERRTMRRPGPLPELLAETPKGPVSWHQHEARVGETDCLDTWCYHFARWAVLEARRLRAKALLVRSVAAGDAPGSVVADVGFVR